MTLRDAVAHFTDPSPAEQGMCGIGLHEAIIREIEGVPVALGFLRPNAIRLLASRPEFGPV
jgi:hypothetical protein